MAVTVLVAAALALPVHGVVVPGKSLGGVRLHDSSTRVRALWGPKFGVCRGCSELTWYFNYIRFAPQGAGVEFRGGRVVSAFTLWAPTGWRTPDGVRIGDGVARLTGIYRGMQVFTCGPYLAYVRRASAAKTVFYVVNAKVWGFAVSRPWVPACR